MYDEQLPPQLPHSVEAEAGVLGSILIKPSLINECKLKPVDFFVPRNKLIMQYMYYLREKKEGKPVDPILIADEAGDRIEKIGGIEYLFELQERTPHAGYFQHYQDIVLKNSKLRRAKQVMLDKAAGAGEDPDVYIDEGIKALERIRDESESDSDFVRLGDVLQNHEEMLVERKENKGLTGTKSASSDLDKLTGGWQKQDLIIIGARPSMGKTDFMVASAIEGEEHNLRMGVSGSATAIISLEMAKVLVAERALCNISNIDNKKLKSGMMEKEDWERWALARDRLNQLPIFIDDKPGQTIRQIARKVERLKMKYPNLTVYVDFLQKVRAGTRNMNKREGVEYVSEELKQIARDYECPVIALAALSRKCEERQDKRPMMSDLRESGSIESDADIVAFLYRDDYYIRESSKKGIAEIIIAKGRNVGTGLVELAYLPQFSKYLTLDRNHHSKKDGD